MNKNLVYFVASNLLTRGMGYFIQLTLIFFVSVEDVGYLRISQSFIEVGVLIAGFGLTTGILKVNSEQSLCEFDKKNNYLTSVVLTFFSSIFVCLVIIVVAINNVFSSIGVVNDLMIYSSFYCMLNSFVNLIICDYQIKDKYKELSFTQFKIKLLSLLVFVMLIYSYGIYGYVLGLYFSAGLAITIMFKNTFEYKLFSIDIAKSIMYIKNVKRIAFFAMMSNGVNLTTKYASVFIAASMNLNEREFGYLSIALTISLGLEILTNSVQQFYLPKLSKTSSNMSYWKLKFNSIENKYSLLSLFIFIITNFIFYLLVANLFNEYQNVFIYYSIISTSWLISSFYTMKGPAFISIGRTDINFVVVLTSSPIVFILSYFLVSEFEVLGVALAKIAHSSLMTASYIYAFRRVTNVAN